jgi:glycerol-3-phosphate cytidylyltransferase
MERGDVVKKYNIGYTTGVFDMFHIGHLNILRRAKEHCDYLIVGVTTDELVSYKNTKAIVPQHERMAIIESIKYVDKVVLQESMDKMDAWNNHHFDVMFVGSDWKGTEKWNAFEREFGALGVDIVYFPYTRGTSSTQLKDVLEGILHEHTSD